MQYKNVKSKLNIDNKQFFYEIIKSKHQNRITDEATDMLIQLANHAINVLHYDDDLDKEDCIQAALHDIFKYWKNFNENVSNNPFAFYTQIAKNAYAKEYKKIHRNRFLKHNKVFKVERPINSIDEFVKINKYIEKSISNDDEFIKYFRYSKTRKKFSDWFMYEVKFLEDDDDMSEQFLKKMQELTTSLNEIVNFADGPFYIQIKYEFKDNAKIISLDNMNGNDIYTI